ncbi:hypothetical protein Z043_115578 [Scleropages formosus]|uniref:Serine/threonine-protein kinase n=1 Tax=Scleropages formosus TaxID=113540 RepID=A0A0P7U7N3_SCLFO|nr:hypothetical protein Z043_115578 [Scleropages formosus]
MADLYSQGALLSEGGFGCVYEGFRKADGLPVAIKYVSKMQAKQTIDMYHPTSCQHHLPLLPSQDRLIPREVALMKLVNPVPASPHIVQLIEWFDLCTEFAIVLERPYPCQDLLDFITDRGYNLTEDEARKVMLQVLEALRTCQDRGVVHRDLKPDNLLIQTNTLQVKLIDFGCATYLKDTPYNDFEGTEIYFPPEWFLQKQYLAGPATVWSFGVTLYTVLHSHLPFPGRDEIVKHILVIRPEISDSKTMGDEGQHVVISFCGVWNPKQQIAQHLSRWSIIHGSTRAGKGAWGQQHFQ